MTPHFREGRPEDGEQLLNIHTRAILELAQGFYPQDELVSWAHGLRAEAYGEIMQGEEFYEVACLVGGDVVGFCSTKENEIMGLYVHADYARQGVATGLLMRAMQRLRGEGHASLKLIASVSALDFYRRHGWRETDRFMQPTRGGLSMVAINMVLEA